MTPPAGANHELTNPVFPVRLSVGVDGSEPFVVVMVAREDDLDPGLRGRLRLALVED